MFGYIQVYQPELKFREFERYRAYYCGLCRDLKEGYGLSGEWTLSYDLTFLALLLTSLYEPEEQVCYGRCLSHPFVKRARIRNQFSAYAADINLLLAYHKALDDWQDEHKPSALLTLACLRKNYQRLARKYPEKTAHLTRQLQSIHALEADHCDSHERIANRFGEIMGDLFVYRKDEWSDVLFRIGFFLGKFIYLTDAFDDLHLDLQKKNYNPLISLWEKDPIHFSQTMKELLYQTAGECTKSFEKLPLLKDVSILRNILYAGIFNGYLRADQKLQKKMANRPVEETEMSRAKQ